jgi:hypothetical protein
MIGQNHQGFPVVPTAACTAAEAAKGQLKTKTDSDKINRPAERTREFNI